MTQTLIKPMADPDADALPEHQVAPSPIIPAIDEAQASPMDCLLHAHGAYNPRSEQIRKLRTELLLRNESSNSANIVSVLSPCPREGRSQLAAELAISFAQLGRPTLLVDADLRHPRQHALFNTDNSFGLSQALASGQRPQLRRVIGLPALFLLTSGPTPVDPLELLSDRWFEILVAEWRKSFRFVVVDTPAAGRYADSLVIATIVGRILSVSHAGCTPYKDTRNMLRSLAATQSRILGAVINHF